MHTVKSVLIYTALAVCFSCYLSCYPVKKPLLQGISEIKVISWFEIADTTGGVTILKDTLFVFFKGNYTLYKLPYRNIYISNGETETGSKGYDYFIRRNDAINGLRFESLNNLKGEIQNADSLLKRKAFAGSVTYYLIEDNKLLSEYGNSKNDAFFSKTYITNTPEDENNPDTTLLFFSNTSKNINFSFSKYMDSAVNSKLYRTKLIYRAKYYTEYKKNIPARIIEVKFENTELLENENTLKCTFDAFEKLKL
jgi:hypothetical protein